MAITPEKVVIPYVMDITDVKRQVRQLQRLNKQLGNALGKDFTKGATIVRTEISKITTVAKGIKLPSGRFTNQTKQMTTILKGLNGQLFTVKQTVAGTGKNIKILNQTISKGASTAKTFGQNLAFLGKRALLTIPTWLLLRSTFLGFINIFKSSIKFLIDWEFQMAQIRIVGRESEEAIDSLSRSMLSLASSLGISNELLGEGAKLFIQQGRSAKEVIPLLDATAKLSLLTGRSIVQSVEDLTAILKAFNLDAKSSISIVDSITSVMLSNAITAGDLAAAYKQVGSTASALGITLSGLTGFITAIKEETRDAGGKIGLALRTMFSRIATTSAKSIQQLTGIPLFLDATNKATKRVSPNLRNLEDVISDISLVFNRLGTAQQAQVAKLVAGVRRTNQAIVLFKNFNTAIKAQTEALLGLGKADTAVAKLTDTTKLRITQLTNTWKEFVDAVSDTGAIKASLDFLKNQIKAVSVVLNFRSAVELGVGKELREASTEAQRLVDFSQNFKELLGRTQNLSRQLGLAQSASEIELVENRMKIIFDLVQQFNKLNPEIKIDLKPIFDPTDFSKQFEKNIPKFIDLDIKQRIELRKLEFQIDRTQIAKELEFIRNILDIPLQPSFKFSSKQVKEVAKEQKQIQGIFDKLTIGERITQDEIIILQKYTDELNLASDVALGTQKIFERLVENQNESVDSAKIELDIRKETKKEFEREKKLRKTIETTQQDLFDIEIDGIASGKTKIQILEEQLKIFDDINRVLDTNLEQQAKSIRRTLEQNKASEKRKGLGLLVNNQLQLLRSQGALNSEILKAEALYRKQAGLQDTANEKLARQLGIQRAINEEKELGNQVSQRTQILAKIAREEGIKTAISIGRVLKGEQDFDIFLRIGGKPLEVFKKEFSQIFQEQLDIKFLRKKGFNIPVALEDEAFIRGTKKNLAGLALQIARLKSNTDATNNNTIAIRDLIAKQTPGIDGRAKTIGLRQPTSTFAERQQALQRSQSVTRREFLDITVKVDSFEGRFQGSPEAIRQLAQRVSVEVAQAVEDKIVNDIKNKPQSPSAQAVDQRINEF